MFCTYRWFPLCTHRNIGLFHRIWNRARLKISQPERKKKLWLVVIVLLGKTKFKSIELNWFIKHLEMAED